MANAEVYYSIFDVLGLTAIILGAAYLFVMALIVRDFSSIRNHPFRFALEWLMISIIPALPFLVFAVTRNITFEKARIWFVSVAIKFTIFHILMQLSGYYTHLFGEF
jgi:hypothetical protein